LASVTAAAVADPLNRAVAPLAGAVNVTVTPLSNVELASRTVTRRADGNALFVGVLWGVPAEAATLAGLPGVRTRRFKGAAGGCTCSGRPSDPTTATPATNASAHPKAILTAIPPSFEPGPARPVPRQRKGRFMRIIPGDGLRRIVHDDAP
jgi:hypothetical protein